MQVPVTWNYHFQDSGKKSVSYTDLEEWNKRDAVTTRLFFHL